MVAVGYTSGDERKLDVDLAGQPNGWAQLDDDGLIQGVNLPPNTELTAHEEAADPHPGYLKETGGAVAGRVEVDGLDIVGAAAGSAKLGTVDDPAATSATNVLDVRSISATEGAAFFKVNPTGGSATGHAMTARQAATSGTGSAGNFTSDNDFSCVQVSGKEKSTGTIKVTHNGQADGSDAGAAALSLDIKTAGTAAQGIFVTGTTGPTTGNLITLRNNSRDDFVVKGTGRVGVGVATGATPAAQLDVRPPDASTKGVLVQAFDASSAANLELRNSAGTPTAVVSKDGDLAVLGNALGIVTPANHGLTAWAYDPALALNGSLLTNGTVYLVKVHVPLGASVTKVYWHVSTAGATPTAGQNFVGVYDSTGARLATTNVDADISSTGLKTTTIAATGLSTGAFYWLAFVFNASTAPSLARTTGLAGAGGLVNVGLTAAGYRFATNGTAQTSLPASVTPGSASQGLPLWAAVGA